MGEKLFVDAGVRDRFADVACMRPEANAVPLDPGHDGEGFEGPRRGGAQDGAERGAPGVADQGGDEGRVSGPGQGDRDVGAAAKDEKFCAYIQKEIDRVNENLARVQTIKKWVIIPGEFTVEGGELTPTMKIKRKIIRDKYAEQIKQLYA